MSMIMQKSGDGQSVLESLEFTCNDTETVANKDFRFVFTPLHISGCLVTCIIDDTDRAST